MRVKKIRGHKRRWGQIDNWIFNHKNLNIDYLKKNQREYVKIWVHPWSGLSLTYSLTPEPNGQTKTRIIHGLIEIYDSWKKDLDKLDIEYDLKIWLFDPRFSKSQVVCYIGDYLGTYKKAFNQAPVRKSLDLRKYSNLQDKLTQFNWVNFLDEDFIFDSDPIIFELKGDVWVGDK